VNDDYLWDRSGDPDPEVQRLETLLFRYRTRAPLRIIPLRRHSWVWARRIAIAAVILAGAFAAYLALLPRFGQPGAEWPVMRRAGLPSIEGAPLRGSGALRIGQALRTDATSRAEIRAGHVGRIEVEPNSVIRLVQTGNKHHRLSLEQGRISARLWSPPFTFSFATPAAVASDLGCAFILEVGHDGEDTVRVTSGWVEFNWEDRQELIPAGAIAVAMRGSGPGTAFFEDASEEFKSALRQINFGPPDHRAPLKVALRSARARDVYSLLRLSVRAGGEERGLIYDRAAQLVPPPPGVTRQAFIDRDAGAFDSWIASLGLGDAKRWWVHWKDAL
jgi:FecR-like protein